ncbi:MAG: DUF4292 domain-containing protein [Nitrospinota bacterium]
MKGPRAAAAGFLLALAAGCVSVGPVSPPPEASRYLDTPDSLLEKVRHRRGRFRDLSGLVKITLNSPREHYSGKAVLLLQGKGSIRLEPLNFFGQPVLYIVAHKDRLQAYAPGEGNYFRGRATVHNVYQWLGIPLSPEEVVTVLWGGVRTPGGAGRLKAQWDGSVGVGGSYRLESLRGGKAVRRWWVDARTLLPVRFQAMDSLENVLLTVRYDSYRRESGVLLPVDVEVAVGPTDRTLDLRYGRVTVNQGLAPLAFHLPVPPGAHIISLDR